MRRPALPIPPVSLRLPGREAHDGERAEDRGNDADPGARGADAPFQLRARAALADAHEAVTEVKRKREGAERMAGGNERKARDGRREFACEGDDGFGGVAIAREDGQAKADEVVGEEQREHGAAQAVQGEPGTLARSDGIGVAAPLPDEVAEERVEAEREPKAERLRGDDPAGNGGARAELGRAEERAAVARDMDEREAGERDDARDLEGELERAVRRARRACRLHGGTLACVGLRRSRMLSPSLLRPVAALVLALAGTGCHGSRQGSAPPISLAEGGPAQAEYRQLRTLFFDADAPGRAALTPRLGDFLQRYPNDPRALDVRVYLAFARIEAGDRLGARAFLEPALKGAEGPRRDFAHVAEAAIFTRSGEAPRALQVLRALDGALVDLDERFVYGEERSRAAFVAGAYDDAVEAVLAWLVQAPLDRQNRARVMAEELLDLAPTPALVRALSTLKHEQEGGARADLELARAWLSTTIAHKLTLLALAHSDGELSRNLLDVGPVALRVSPDGERLAALASARVKAPVVAGRSVGLLLSLGGPLERRRAAAVAAGITRVLGSARAGAGGPGVDLLVRYDTSDVDAALAGLAADGAALFVAGNDDETARIAAARAEVLRIPLILLRAPQRTPSPHGFTFVLGEGDVAVEQALIQALDTRGRRELARVGSGGTPCDVEPEAPGRPRFPLATWHKSGVDALLVLGDVDCARDLAAEVKSSRESLLLALGLDASPAYATLGSPTLAPAAGAYPASAPAGGWYEALGHDAAVLTAQALAALPPAVVARPEEVAALHEKARDALANAQGELWTSAARGFGGARSLPRELSVMSFGPNER